MNDLKYKMEIAYDGTHYGGWQVQPNSTSIQTLIQNALEVVLRKPVMATGSGRTDAGVHALAQVAHFTTGEEVDTYRLLLSLNALLPHDIRIKSLKPASDDFHARYSAIGKIYHYHLHLDRIMSPFKRLYCHQVFDKIDLDLLKQAARFFLGTHDFTSFANEAHKGSAAINAVRTLKRLDIIDEQHRRSHNRTLASRLRSAYRSRPLKPQYPEPLWEPPARIPRTGA